MRKTNRFYFGTMFFTLIFTVMAISLTSKPGIAKSHKIPTYVQIRIENVIEHAISQGDPVQFGKMDLGSIIALLDNKNQRIASAAAYALGEIRDPKAVPALVASLKNDHDHMRRIAAHALGKIGDSSAVLPLIEILCDGTQPVAVQASAVVSLSKIGDPRAKWILNHLNQSQQSWLQKTANMALLKINSKNDFTLAAVK